MGKIKLVLNGNISIFDENNKAYKSIIQDIDEDSILINVPCGGGEYYLLEDNKEYEMNYYDGSLYYVFNTILIKKEHDKDKSIPLYKIGYPYNVKRIQRRDFVRVDLIDYMKYKNVNEETDLWNDGMILDISGGGLRTSTQQVLNQDDILDLNINVSDDIIEVKGKVVRYIGISTSGKVYGIEFTDISEGIREKIIRKVFEQMRKQRNSN